MLLPACFYLFSQHIQLWLIAKQIEATLPTAIQGEIFRRRRLFRLFNSTRTEWNASLGYNRLTIAAFLSLLYGCRRLPTTKWPLMMWCDEGL